MFGAGYKAMHLGSLLFLHVADLFEVIAKHETPTTIVYHSASTVYCTQSGSNHRQSVDNVKSYHHQSLPIGLLSTASASCYNTVTDTRRNQNAGSCVHQ